MNISPNFKLEELIRSDYAIRKGIDNTPTEDIIENLKVLAEGLEKVRILLHTPMFISSGYRSPEVNKGVGSKNTSDHPKGFAADFTAPQFGHPKKVVEAIKLSGIKYHQLIFEGTWVHISFAPKLKQETLTAVFIDGKAVYKEFV